MRPRYLRRLSVNHPYARPLASVEQCCDRYLYLIVRVGLRIADLIDDETARITGAIKPGDKIVALGSHLLCDGQPGRLAKPATVAAVEEGQP